MAIWNILRTCGISYGRLVHFLFNGYIFSGLGLCTKKNLATLVEVYIALAVYKF
jgi:hypothetical protein